MRELRAAIQSRLSQIPSLQRAPHPLRRANPIAMGLRRALTASLMFAVACGAFLNAPLSTSAAQLRAAAVQTATRAAAPSMIVGELEKAAAAVKGAAAEQVIRQKVEKKLEGGGFAKLVSLTHSVPCCRAV